MNTYTQIRKEGWASMQSDTSLFHRMHYAAGGDYGLPHGSGIWLNTEGDIVTNEFPFDDTVFLSAEPMTDEEFAQWVKPCDTEISIDEVDFTDMRGA